MSRLSRFTQKLFGSGATTNQIAQYGSLAAGAPARYSGTTITPALIQSLSEYTNGWFSAVIGQNSPAIEDVNALDYLFAYQLSYLLQLGIPEWDSGTTYYIGSFAQDGAGNLYTSLTNNNTNNALTSTANWLSFKTNVVPVWSSTYIYSLNDIINYQGQIFRSSTNTNLNNTPAASSAFWNTGPQASYYLMAGNFSAGSNDVAGSFTKVFDTTNSFDGNSTFTAPEGKMYTVSMSTEFSPQGSSNYLFGKIYVNGVNYNGLSICGLSGISSSNTCTISGTTGVWLNSGDTLQFFTTSSTPTPYTSFSFTIS